MQASSLLLQSSRIRIEIASQTVSTRPDANLTLGHDRQEKSEVLQTPFVFFLSMLVRRFGVWRTMGQK